MRLLRQLPKCGRLRPWRTGRTKSTCGQPSGSELNAVGGALSQHLMGRSLWLVSVHGVPAAWFLPTRLPASLSAQKLRQRAQGRVRCGLSLIQCEPVECPLSAGMGKDAGPQRRTEGAGCDVVRLGFRDEEGSSQRVALVLNTGGDGSLGGRERLCHCPALKLSLGTGATE